MYSAGIMSKTDERVNILNELVNIIYSVALTGR